MNNKKMSYISNLEEERVVKELNKMIDILNQIFKARDIQPDIDIAKDYGLYNVLINEPNRLLFEWQFHYPTKVLDYTKLEVTLYKIDPDLKVMDVLKRQNYQFLDKPPRWSEQFTGTGTVLTTKKLIDHWIAEGKDYCTFPPYR